MKNLLWVAAFLIGCGSDGVSDSKKLADLTAGEAKDVCLEFAADHPPRTVDCGNGVTFEIGIEAADCETNGSNDTPTTCTATVGDARDCNDAIYDLTDAQLCDSNTPEPAACAALNSAGCE